MRAIFKKELRSYFTSYLGYVFIAMVMILFGIFFAIYCMYAGFNDFGSYVLGNAGSYLIFFIPLLTMRVFAEEQKNRTDQLLLTAPVKTWDIVLGKYFALCVIVLIALVLTMIMPLTIRTAYKADIDVATTFGGYIALVCLCLDFLAIGLYVSSKTTSQLVAVVITLGVILVTSVLSGIEGVLPTEATFSLVIMILLLALVGLLIYYITKNVVAAAVSGGALIAVAVVLYIIKAEWFEGLTGKILGWLNLLTRYQEVFSGVFNFSQIFFFIGFAVFFLVLTVQSIEKRRWS